ncbi:AcrR family transcriptional regulator [Actinoalloteichus hoggarensis]|uniref:Transcriptional regulator, TetR family n=1 Tax=Actinoalloteichus hoggarensis TaxID=1470176 RepID=A0A221W475_9PSEU|nr:TetR/AcrR family transcriptional regulator [Actinoalloteichus hoggarensis]ASO20451.1 Transcriptional regulator, TetR family [Actinoalloteichus hoggarensis]MBB5923491.1 AcrR family transcriptional regulator [Actinoalloteichus hoggarensis]
MRHEESAYSEQQDAARPGRRRDHTRDGVILDATLEVLAEEGYERMTMDMVAVRAKAGKATVYRRWPSKGSLVVDAIARLGRREVGLDELPDTGTIRQDLRALFRPEMLQDGERRFRVMAGLTSLLVSDRSGLAQAAHAASTEPWVTVNRTLIQRAIDRGEVRVAADVETLAQVVPSMAAYRVVVERKPIDPDFLIAVIDGVLLPALGLPPAWSGPDGDARSPR